MSKPAIQKLHKNITTLIQQVQENLYRIFNAAVAETNFHTGRLIVEFEQSGHARASYARETLINLSKKLQDEFGKGYSVDNLENMRKFYLAYKNDYAQFHNGQKSETVSRKSEPRKSETLSRKLKQVQKSAASRKYLDTPFRLSWSHYLVLMRMDDENERKFYEIEAANEYWSVRELKRQYDTSLYERLVLSRNKKKVRELSKKGHVISKPVDAIKDPLILEFLDFQEQEYYTETDLEDAIISKLQYFLRELGKGFLFVARQYRFRLEDDDYKIDLVFYHRILRCFVLIDLKIGGLKHEDLGQMQMYVNYFDEEVKDKTENKTIGLILCKNKKESIIKYTLPKGNRQIFASKYKMYLPAKNDLLALMEPPAPPYGVN